MYRIVYNNTLAFVDLLGNPNILYCRSVNNHRRDDNTWRYDDSRRYNYNSNYYTSGNNHRWASVLRHCLFI